ncbi:MAG: cupin domain-containing protein [Sphingomonadaceae bacterium]|nr:cupin domain-containing protein [Sphingomonadaceae bacterium]
MRLAALLSVPLLSGCASLPAAGGQAILTQPQGVNLVLEGAIEAAPGYHLVMGDLVMPAGGVIPRHTHSGEEFLYVMGGSATVMRQGEPDLVLQAGQGVRIPAGMVHGGLAGPEGMRGVASWIVKDGQPLRTAATD